MSEKTNDLPSVGTEDARSLAELLKCGMGCGPTERKAATMLRALVSERDELASRVRELEAEVLDQCRLNGMGAERESALMGRVRELESAALAAQPGAVGEPVKWAMCTETETPCSACPTAGTPCQARTERSRDFGDLIFALDQWKAAPPGNQSTVALNRLEAVIADLAAAPTEAKPAQDAVDAERLPPMPENVLADIQQAHEYVSMWAKGEAYYAPVSAYDDMLGKRKATIKDVMKSAKFIAPRLMSASLAMRDYFAAIDVYTNKKGGV